MRFEALDTPGELDKTAIMAPNEPLFADRRGSSIHSEERAEDEDTALLSGQKSYSAPQQRTHFWREVGLFTWAVIATAAVIVLAVLSQHQSTPEDGKSSKPTGKRNLIFMVSDGMGPASLSMTRSFRQFQGEVSSQIAESLLTMQAPFPTAMSLSSINTSSDPRGLDPRVATLRIRPQVQLLFHAG